MSTFSLSSCPLLRRFIDLLACSTLGLLAGCASVDGLGKPLRHGEVALETRGDRLDWNYHSLLEYSAYAKEPGAFGRQSGTSGNQSLACASPAASPPPECRIHGHGLHFPGYVIALEKSPRKRIGLDLPRAFACDCASVGRYFAESKLVAPPCKETPSPSLCFLQRRLDDGERLFVSHVLRFAATEGPSARIVGQPIYDAYRSVAPPAGPGEKPLPLETKLFEAGISGGLEAFEAQLKRDIAQQSPTHILIYVMGWNTGEIEALENFNNLSGFLADAAEGSPEGKAFKPLVIGMTWPSAWSFGTSPADDLLRGFSFANKKNDADEVGAVWLSRLLHDILPRVRGQGAGPAVVAFGHSFGARALSRGVHSCSLVRSDDCSRHAVDLAVGYLPAEGRSRYAEDQYSSFVEGWSVPPLPPHHEGIPYTDYSASLPTAIPQAAFWSGYDTATAHFALMGSYSAIDNTLLPAGRKAFQHVPEYRPIRIDHDTRHIVAPPSLEQVRKELRSARLQPGKVLLIDGSGFIQHSAPLHGGAAHSDIYSREVGEASWELIRRFPPR